MNLRADRPERVVPIKKHISEGYDLKQTDWILDAVDLPLILLGRNLECIYANRGFRELCGCSESDCLSRSITDIGNSVFDKAQLGSLLNTVQTNDLKSSKALLKLGSGSSDDRDVEVTVKSVMNPGSGNGNLLVTFEDVTDGVEIEKELSEKAALLDMAHESIITRDMQDTIEFWNRGAERRYGFTRNEAIGRNIHELLKTRFPEPLGKIEADLQRNGFWAGELVHQCKNARKVVVESRWVLIAGGGTVRRKLEIDMDITDRKIAEDRLKFSQRKYKSLANSIADPFFALDREYRFTYWNLAAADYFSEDVSDVIGKQVDDIFADIRWSEIVSFLKKQVDGTDSGRGIFQVVTGQITRHLEINTYPIDGGTSVIVRDITGQIGADARIKDLNTQLTLHAARLERVNTELEAFTYSVSHDLQAPLRRIQGFSKALVEDEAHEMSFSGRKYVERISAAAENMSQLIGDLLRLFRISQTEMRILPTDISRIAHEIADGLKTREPERRVSFLIEPDLKVKGDPNLLKVALQNMFENSWKYTKEKNSATIEFGRFAGDSRDFYIRDNGVGFDMKHSDKLFVPFQRLHSAADFGGTGIGLAIVKKVIDSHGGEIWAESVPGKETMFRFTIPERGE